MNFKIIADSSADMLSLDGAPFEVTPLKIVTSNKEYIDDISLDVNGMVEELFSYKGKSSSSCPNTDEWLTAFGDTGMANITFASGLLEPGVDYTVTLEVVGEEEAYIVVSAN